MKTWSKLIAVSAAGEHEVAAEAEIFDADEQDDGIAMADETDTAGEALTCIASHAAENDEDDDAAEV